MRPHTEKIRGSSASLSFYVSIFHTNILYTMLQINEQQDIQSIIIVHLQMRQKNMSYWHQRLNHSKYLS